MGFQYKIAKKAKNFQLYLQNSQLFTTFEPELSRGAR